MKNNYPIKYAVIPMIEQVGWSRGMHELERVYDTVCYIVSKCYLIGENKKYRVNGTVMTEYQVVCPFKEGEYYTWYKDEPSYNLINESCTNVVLTDALFDTFDEAKVVKNEKNKDLLLQKFLYMPIKKNKAKHKEIEEEFKQIIMYYDQLEKEIEKRTNNLEINKLPKEQRVLCLRDNVCKKVCSSLYEIIDVFDSSNYIVYSVTNEEFGKLQELSTNNVSCKTFNHTPLLINNGKLKTARVVSLSGEEMYLINNGLVNHTNAEFIMPNNYDEVFYTIEDYDDIIKSYSNRLDNSNVIKLVRK